MLQTKQPLTIFGDGLQTRDFIYVNDVARANVAALNSNYQGVLNVATGKTVSLLELIDVLEKIADYTCDKQFNPAREGDIEHSAASTTKLNTALNIDARYSLEEGLRELLNEPVRV